jgi:hypothetical protein
VGGSIRLKHIEKASEACTVSLGGHVGPLSRTAYRTLGAGRVRLRLSTCLQDRRTRKDERKAGKEIRHRQRVEEQREKKSAGAAVINTGQGVSLRIRNPF